MDSWRNSKKVRLWVIFGLLALVAVLFFFVKGTWAKVILGGVMAILLAALGMEASNTDYDLGKVIETGSFSESRVMRDVEGNVVTEGGKYTDEYNCDDFATQPEAQRFFEAAGGVSGDTNRLDGNKDGEACESLPKDATAR